MKGWGQTPVKVSALNLHKQPVPRTSGVTNLGNHLTQVQMENGDGSVIPPLMEIAFVEGQHRHFQTAP